MLLRAFGAGVLLIATVLSSGCGWRRGGNCNSCCSPCCSPCCCEPCCAEPCCCGYEPTHAPVRAQPASLDAPPKMEPAQR